MTDAPAKKAPRRRLQKKSDAIIVIKTEEAPVEDLHLYYKNPNVGDINEIAISLNENGQFKPIVVNIGTLTGRPYEVLAGNHTYLAARKEVYYDAVDEDGMSITKHKPSWPTVYTSFVDVDERTATKIVLVDNETAAKSHRIEAKVAELLASLPEVSRVGTGYTTEETEALVANAKKMADEALRNAESIRQQQAEEDHQRAVAKTFSGSPLGEEGDYDPDDDDEDMGSSGTFSGPKIEDASEDLGGMFAFKPPEELVFPSSNFWGIPELRDDMLMTWKDLPDNLDSWAGSATAKWPDPEQWWLYNWGVDSTSGMQDISRVIVSFYCFDQYFERWWYMPEKYVAKVLNSGIKYILTPNFSQSTDLPMVESLMALYKARWLGRYFQEAGLKLCPDITWRDGDLDWLKKYVLGTLKKGMPMIAIQMQTLDPENVTGGIEHLEEQVAMVFDELEPEALLCYAGREGTDLMKRIVPKKVKQRYIGTRMAKLSEAAKGRERKKTI